MTHEAMTNQDAIEQLKAAYGAAMEGRKRDRTYKVGNDSGDPDDDYEYYIYHSDAGRKVVFCGHDWGLYRDDANLIATCLNLLPVLWEKTT